MKNDVVLKKISIFYSDSDIKDYFDNKDSNDNVFNSFNKSSDSDMTVVDGSSKVEKD